MHYAWQRSTSDGGFIAVGADQPTYTLTDADVGSQIRVFVFYTDADGTPEQLQSDPTLAVLNANTAPTIISNGGGENAALFSPSPLTRFHLRGPDHILAMRADNWIWE